MSSGQRPHIVCILSDQQRADTVGCFGQPLPVTPHLDWLASRGVRFSRAFTCQPVCGPARASLQTGRYATATGCFRNGIALRPTEKTIANYLHTAGYRTGYVGKWHLASDGPEHSFETAAIPRERRGGYRDFWMAADVLEFTSHGYGGYLFDNDGQRVDFPKGRYRADVLTDHALRYLDTWTADQPSFLFLSYLEPHHQNDRDRYEGPRGVRSRFTDFIPPPDLPEGTGNWRSQYPDYLACCHAVDKNVGRIIRRLRHRGLWNNTLVIYTSDHGCHFRTRNAEYKRSCHESSIHVPMIIHGPGFTGGITEPRLVSLLDVAPTILTAAQITVPPQMHGMPLQSLISDSQGVWRDAVLIQISEDHIGRALRTDRWKYAVWVPSDRHWSGVEAADSPVYTERYLYDLRADPAEMHNLVRSPEYAPIRQTLAHRLKQLMQDAGEREPTILPAPASGPI